MEAAIVSQNDNETPCLVFFSSDTMGGELNIAVFLLRRKGRKDWKSEVNLGLTRILSRSHSP